MRTKIIMNTKNILSIGIAGLVALSLFPGSAVAAPGCEDETENTESDADLSGDNGEGGAVYLMTNQVPNAIMAFRRSHNGGLTAVGTFPTGGDGNPVAEPEYDSESGRQQGCKRGLGQG